MTIDDAITIFHGLECNPLFSEKHFKAFDMAIASLEAWQKVRQDIQTETDDKSNNMYFNLGMLGALAIINKHLQEVVSRTGAESEE
jgi:hypothetical protein